MTACRSLTFSLLVLASLSTQALAGTITRSWVVTPFRVFSLAAAPSADGMPTLPKGWALKGDADRFFARKKSDAPPLAPPDSTKPPHAALAQTQTTDPQGRHAPTRETQGTSPYRTAAPSKTPTADRAVAAAPTLAESDPSDDAATDTPALTVDADAHSIWLPIDEAVPVAAYQHGDTLVIITGTGHPFSTGTAASPQAIRWQQKTFSTLTVVTIDWPGMRALTITPDTRHGVSGWTVQDDAIPHSSDVPAAPPDRITPTQLGNTIILPLAESRDTQAARTVEIADPISGRRVAVGLVTGKPAAVDRPFRGTGYALKRSLLGVAVYADDDTIELRVVREGFALDAIGRDAVPTLLPQIRQQPGMPSLMLSSARPEILRETFRRAWTAAAMATPAARRSRRFQAARAALALGDVRTARMILDVATSDAPQEHVSGEDRLLVRALHAFGPDQADTPPSADNNTPEDQFWRGLSAMHSPSKDETANAHDATLMAAGLATLAAYPAPLRARLIPEVAEWIARHGDADARSALAILPASPRLRLADALALARQRPAAALGALNTLSRDPDPIVAAKAREAALLAAVTTHRMRRSAAGAALDALRPSARLAGREENVLLAEAALFDQAGHYAEAWRALQATPGKTPAYQAALHQLADHLITLNPDPAAPAQQNAATLATMQHVVEALPVADETAQALREHLAATYHHLGLTDRETDQLAALLPLLTQESDKQRVGARLAARLLSDGKNDAADTVLSNAFGGAPTEAVRRQLAEVALDRHENGTARRLLGELHDDAALLLRATMAEDTQDWKQAGALLAQSSVFHDASEQPLSHDQQDLIVRRCADAARVDDQPTVTRLVRDYASRITDPALHILMQAFAANPKTTLSLTQR